ncbi:uncharacterized protein LOC127375052 [Dicentrarchus labrax]|uniref:uncharacterized protein LOC127375052 n=1 Tax=Dicentrarchus labrax TaxID=13489 RepID=UPI0021F58BA4|nr:uncharacterized protein LOC127375052 [Dicentrarchus labrax]
MFVLHWAPVLVSLLSFSAAAPTTDDCSQLTQLLTANDLHQILGKWIFIEGCSNNEIFDSVFKNTESMWMMLNTTADNQTLVLDQASQLVPQQHQATMQRQCLRGSHNVPIVDDKVLELHFAVAHTYHRFLQTCLDCLIMYTYTKENDFQALYLFGKNTTLTASDLETFRKQAACLKFPLPAKFHYDTSKELCPM